MDLEGQDLDMDNLVKPSTSGYGIGSVGTSGPQGKSGPQETGSAGKSGEVISGSLGPCGHQQADAMSEKQPLPDCDSIVPQNDLQLDLEKGHTNLDLEKGHSAITGAMTPKDVIVMTTDGSVHKKHMKFLQKREIVFCMIGGVAFLIGLIMTVVGLLIMQSKCDKTYWVSTG